MKNRSVYSEECYADELDNPDKGNKFRELTQIEIHNLGRNEEKRRMGNFG